LRAYLIAWLEKSSLKAVGADIYDEKTPKPHPSFFPVIVYAVERPTYHEARRALVEQIYGLSEFAWLLPLLPSDKERL
jgi:hypothetical protein